MFEKYKIGEDNVPLEALLSGVKPDGEITSLFFLLPLFDGVEMAFCCSSLAFLASNFAFRARSLSRFFWDLDLSRSVTGPLRFSLLEERSLLEDSLGSPGPLDRVLEVFGTPGPYAAEDFDIFTDGE